MASRRTDRVAAVSDRPIGPRRASALRAALLTAAFTACGASAPATGTAAEVSLAGPPCGAAASQTLAEVDGSVAERIYADELSGPSTRADERQVEGYGPLLRAVAAGNRAAVGRAVRKLVFSHTHIVRLRVSGGSSVLVDFGGPYVIAPVAGTLRYRGRTVGGYLLSVQDDLGFLGLETRLIGDPLSLRLGSTRVPIQGTIPSVPAILAGQRRLILYGGASYETFSFDAHAFPTGVLRVTLLVPAAGPSSGRSCAAIRVAEFGRIAQRIWKRFRIDSEPDSAYVAFLQSHTGGLGFIRSGRHQLGGSSRPGPPRLPDSGAVLYGGVAYGVSSFPVQTAAGSARVYLLIALQAPG